MNKSEVIKKLEDAIDRMHRLPDDYTDYNCEFHFLNGVRVVKDQGEAEEGSSPKLTLV